MNSWIVRVRAEQPRTAGRQRRCRGSLRTRAARVDAVELTIGDTVYERDRQSFASCAGGKGRGRRSATAAAEPHMSLGLDRSGNALTCTFEHRPVEAPLRAPTSGVRSGQLVLGDAEVAAQH